ncbi:carotenoid oxygenase family protein [Gordonia insulae]|uniref:Dioxygenase n=1 Tax=Gordonia insulae TaxID=2420509 RepID=A0A3G8JK05_9ACTN|nr:carotenoid oxygenase family protein [Gordonia insulae]AZG44540.1 8'-apo-carotenoid 13,14-cleaving dioxygenase [Gordonia insulae]
MSTAVPGSATSFADVSDYVSGPYAPVADEITAVDLPVEGELPAELNGRYVRNGPNPADVGSLDLRAHHWFVGDGMVHGVRLRDGRAEWYRNRFVGSAKMSAARGLPDIPGPNWSGNQVGPNTSVAGFAGTTWAVVEAGGCPVELDYELETLGRNDFYGTLPGAFTAHPKRDPSTGELHAMVYAWAQWMDHVQYIVVGVDGRVRHALDIPLSGMTMLHDMSLTPNWAIIYDQPCTADIDVAMTGQFPFRWNPDYGNRIGLLPRTGEGGTGASAADIIWIDVPLGYVFHPLNAFERDDGTVVIDVCNYQKMFAADVFGPFRDGLSRLERWDIDPGRRSCSVTVVDETPNEFPVHRGSVGLQEHRYGYCSAPSLDRSQGWPTLKHDLLTGERRIFDHGPGRAAGEPAFVGRTGGDGAEDDGWLVTFVHDMVDGTAEFVVMDAQEFDRRGYVARVSLPQRVPFGFHGNWISDESVPPPN